MGPPLGAGAREGCELGICGWWFAVFWWALLDRCKGAGVELYVWMGVWQDNVVVVWGVMVPWWLVGEGGVGLCAARVSCLTAE